MQKICQRILSEKEKVTLKNGTNLIVCIEDVKNDTGKRKDIADFMLKHFYSTKPTAIASGIHKSEQALQELHKYLMKNLHSMHAVGYYDNAKGANNLVAVSLMRLVTRNSSHMAKLEIVTKENTKHLGMTEDLQSSFDVLNEFGIDSYYSDFGVAVAPEYQRLGISTHMFQFRQWICEQEGIPLTSAWMTSIGAQIAAERIGYKTVFQIPCEEFARRYTVVFKEAPTFFKLMVKEADIIIT